MLPPRRMATNKNLFRASLKARRGSVFRQALSRRNLMFALLVAAMWTAGCGPPGPRALLEGKRLLEEGKYPEAVEKLNSATELMAGNAQAWNYLGLACHLAGQPDAAASAYQKALKLDHDLVVAHYNLGCLLLE